VGEAGGLGFLAAGYKTATAVGDEIAATRSLTRRPFGVNVFVPGSGPADPGAYAGYVASLREDAARLGVEPGAPRFDDDDWTAKVERLASDPVPVVSFAFGRPSAAAATVLHDAGSEIWITVTTPEEAAEAEAAGADVLVVQGIEAGAHQGAWEDGPGVPEWGLLALLQVVADRTRLPLVAAGGIMTGAGIAAVRCAGAAAAQLGTAFLRCPEAGTPAVHRDALGTDAPTRITRAFTGRRARSIVNPFMETHDAAAPVAYPEVHHATAPIRAAARAVGDAGAVSLWTGQAHALSRPMAAGDLVRELGAEAAARLAALGRG
jgi:nitronate monooxygenase